VEREIQKFLEALAAGDGKPMEQMTPTEARAVLVGVQSSVPVDLPKADVSVRNITAEGQTEAAGCSATSQPMSASSVTSSPNPA
jgi:hypothetical protein